MAVTLFVDYGNTIDVAPYPFDTVVLNKPLLDKLVEFHNEGVQIILATDGSNSDSVQYKQSMAKEGYEDLFDGVVTNSTFDERKRSNRYWPQVCRQFGLQGDEVLLIDDNSDVLDNARKSGINFVNSIPKEKVVANLVSKYAELTL